MKSLNFTRNIFSILVLAFTFLVVGRVEGQTTYTGNFSTTNAQFSGSPQNITISSQTWTLTNNGGYYGFDGIKGQQIGSSGSPASSMTLTSNGFQGLITAVKITTSGASSVVANVSVSINGSSFGGAAQSITSTSTQYTFSGSSAGAVSIAWSQTSSKALYIKSVQVIYSASPTITGSATTAAFTSTFGTASVAQTFSVSGSNLSANLVATAPSGFEVSSNGSSYGTTATFTQSAGSASGTLYVRLSATAPIGSYNSQNIVLSSTGATNVNITTPATGNEVTCTSGTWIGSSNGNWNTASNWCGGVPASGSNLTIPAGTTVTLDGANEVIVGNLTINATGSLILPSSAKLTVNGTLTNNGTMTIENGASLVQGASSTLASGTTGTFNVKQFVTGAGGSTPTGRFWYMGLPISNLSRGTAFGAASGANRLWSWTEGTGWSLQLTDNTPLNPTTGYVFRTGSDVTLNFSGTSLYSANMNPTNLSNNGGPLGGCHLLSNPYTAYLDWAQVVDQLNTGTSNISTTYCVRSYNSTNNEMVYDTYNASGGVASNPSSLAVTQFIAPLQAFWIRVNTGFTGNVNITKSMLSHQSSGIGLKDITSFTAFARLNLVSGNFFDQVVVYTDANAGIEVEEYDSEKFFLPNKPQVYCKVGEKKLVINALKSGKAQNAVPLTIELPSTQVYKFEMAESFVENGLVILEDRQEGIFQDMGVNPTYEFYGNSGVVADRFILHFQLPNGTNNEGQAGLEDLTSAQIDVISNQQGEILVSLSSDLTATGDIQILDAAGRLIQTTAIKGQDTKLQITEGTGVYFVRVTTPMKSETKKVLVY